ncbi:hypothetical protein XPN_1196, partial [Xanthomonas arboricola pv. pruni MAFF 301427]
AAAIPTAWPARPFPNRRASWRWPTCSMRCAGGAPTRRRGRWAMRCASSTAWPASNWNRAWCSSFARRCRRSCRSWMPGIARRRGP